ncbi:MAG: hypothetical protein KDC24_12835, partial [Saprospiraceae bacterium]|nr:hypothetical protein [Saprospiraceae bacterium]
MKWSFLLCCLFFLVTQPIWSQETRSNWRTRTLETDTSWQVIDTLTVVPSSFQVQRVDRKNGNEAIDFTLSNNKVRFFEKGVPVRLNYRVLPFDLGRPYFKIDTQYLRQPLDRILIPYNPYAEDNRLPDFGSLQYNGTFARGISFGNSQNLVLNSNLNLQMTGRLTNDIEVLASVSDNSIPLQPEGNTAQLQEFDKVYIQL